MPSRPAPICLSSRYPSSRMPVALVAFSPSPQRRIRVSHTCGDAHKVITQEKVMPNVGDVVAFLEAVVPPDLAAHWDNVGLLLGRRDAVVRRVMTCLTITP